MTMLATMHQPLRHNPALNVLAAQLGHLDICLQEELAHCGVLTVHLARETEIWMGVDQRQRPPRCADSSSFKVLVVLEPPDVKEVCVEGFDLVLTWREAQLRDLPSRARLFIPATPWVLPAEWLQLARSKRPGLGFLRGSKTKTEGHRLRHEVWNERAHLEGLTTLPLDFEEGGGVNRTTRNRQFENQFVLVIENSCHVNYFTEKLLDAMLCGCVPIYWGCPNIGAFFDLAGIVQIQKPTEEGKADTLEAVRIALRGLSPSDYEMRQVALERNAAWAAKYAGDFGKRVEEAIKTHLPSISGGNGEAAAGDEQATLPDASIYVTCAGGRTPDIAS